MWGVLRSYAPWVTCRRFASDAQKSVGEFWTPDQFPEKNAGALFETGADCVFMIEGRWYTDPCDNGRPFVCERKR